MSPYTTPSAASVSAGRRADGGRASAPATAATPSGAACAKLEGWIGCEVIGLT
jgi:hypothetical protein